MRTLKRGAVIGVGAFVAGVGILHATVVLAGPPTNGDLAGSAITYGLLHGIVRTTTNGQPGGTLATESLWLALLFATIPAVPLLVGGYRVSRSHSTQDSSAESGPLAGGTVVAGYLPAMVLAARFFEVEGPVGSPWGPIHSYSLDPTSAAAGAALFAVVFGTVGGLGTRSRRAKNAVIGLTAVCATLGVPLLLVLAH